MTTQIQFSTFSFNTSAVRVITDPNQESWFCGSDVCDILGYANSRKALQDHCKQAGVTKRYISYPSGKKEAIFINEPNLYRLIIKSRKPEAERFEAWVFEEVLPQIRKTGKYKVAEQLSLPQPEPTTTLTLKDSERYTLAWLWFEQGKMLELVAQLQGALDAIQSAYAPTARSQTLEYKRQQQDARPIIARMLADVQYERANRHGLNRILQALNVPPRYGNGNYIA